MNSEGLSQKCFVFRRIKSKIFFAVSLFSLNCDSTLAADMAATNAVSTEPLAEKPHLAGLSNLSIEELLATKVTILGPSESVSKTPAAVSVINQEDIQRSGAMNIPEALRMVPGLDIAQIDASQWAVS